MRIKVKNNKNGRIENEVVVKVVKFYLDKLIGETAEKVNTLTITFKKLSYWRGGYLRTKQYADNQYWIAVNSNNPLDEQLSTLAHECVHLKQYFLGELSQRVEVGRNGRVKHIRTWKGREYTRKAYRYRPWEVEARNKQDKLADNILNKINKPQAEPKPKVVATPVLVSNFASQVLDILKDRELPNGDLVPILLNGNQDRQNRIKVLKRVFALKQEKIIEEVNRNGLIFVKAV